MKLGVPFVGVQMVVSQIALGTYTLHKNFASPVVPGVIASALSAPGREAIQASVGHPDQSLKGTSNSEADETGPIPGL